MKKIGGSNQQIPFANLNPIMRTAKIQNIEPLSTSSKIRLNFDQI